jgi:hypothetical protein
MIIRFVDQWSICGARAAGNCKEIDYYNFVLFKIFVKSMSDPIYILNSEVNGSIKRCLSIHKMCRQKEGKKNE